MRKLTGKQAAFINHYLQCLNATEAAARAGYCGSRESLAVIGNNNLRNVKIREEIDRRLKELTMQADEVLYRLNQHAQGLPPECFDTSYGSMVVDYDKVKELGLSHLIKKITYNAKGHAQPEIYDAQTALIQLGKHYALFTDKVKHEDWRTEAIQFIRNGEIEYEVLASEFGHSLAVELFKRAGVPVSVDPAQATDNNA